MNRPPLYFGLTDRGRVRPRNEDRWFADAEHGLFIVADGIGGRPSGDVASRVVVESLPRLLQKACPVPPEPLDDAASACLADCLADLSTRFRRACRRQPDLAGSGATVVAAIVWEKQAVIGHMGDSRAYLYRGGRLVRLGRDHSLAQVLVEAGEIRPDEADAHPARGRITRFVGMDGDPLPETRRIALAGGDRLLLCTDGLHDMVPEERIAAVLRARPSPETAVRSMVGLANAAGGRDNITAVLIEIAGPASNPASAKPAP